MDIKSRFKKRIRIGGIVLSILLLALLTAFGIHCHSINKYNSHKRSFNYIYSGGSDPAVAKAVKNADNVNADIHQRGQATDTWVKNDESLGSPLNGIIYELSVTNGSASVLNDWSLKLNITEPCYINNAWCGTVEIHQNSDGYPTGKKSKDIPLIGRIICVADSYDAMSSNRVYRSKLSKEEIEEELRRNSGTQFDPEIVEVFLKFLNKKESK